MYKYMCVCTLLYECYILSILHVLSIFAYTDPRTQHFVSCIMLNVNSCGLF